MTEDLKGRSAVITGGLTGQGLAIAEALASSDANVAVGSFVREAAGRQGDAAAYPDPEEIASVREKLARFGTEVYAGHLDVRDSAVIAMFAAAAERSAGRPTFLSMRPAPRPSSRTVAIRMNSG